MCFHLLAYFVFSILVWTSIEEKVIGLCQNLVLGLIIVANFMVVLCGWRTRGIFSLKGVKVYICLKTLLMISQMVLIGTSGSSFYDEFSVRFETKEHNIAQTIVTGYMSGLGILMIPILHHNIFYSFNQLKAVREQLAYKRR